MKLDSLYHDVGLHKGRADHEINSGHSLYEDEKLKQWFTTQNITVMREAVEDHRASNKNEPRSIYGKIVAEADRDIRYETILYRTLQFSLVNFPHYSFEQHYSRIYEHIEEKYGENGYLKLWLHTEENRQGLNVIREALKNKEGMKGDCQVIFEQSGEITGMI